MPVTRIPVDVVMERVPLAQSLGRARNGSPRASSPSARPALNSTDAGRAAAAPRHAAKARNGASRAASSSCTRREAEGYYLNLSRAAAARLRHVAHVRRRRRRRRAPGRRDAELQRGGAHDGRRRAGRFGRVAAADLQAMLVPYIEEHYKPEPKKKVRRNDPFAATRKRPRAPRSRRGPASRRDAMVDERRTRKPFLLSAGRSASSPRRARRRRRARQTRVASRPPASVPPTPTAPRRDAPSRRRRRCRRSSRCRSTPTSRRSCNPNVDESLKRQALRKLFADPRFNVMDGLDVYIDDYTQVRCRSRPRSSRSSTSAKFLFDPPKTRVNAQGHVEDVPPRARGAADAADDERTSRRAVAER